MRRAAEGNPHLLGDGGEKNSGDGELSRVDASGHGFAYIGLEKEARMIKLVYCTRKKPDLSDEQFFRYWKDVHGPIGARIPGLRRLVQSHTVAGAAELGAPDFHGMAELWFDDIESLLAARQSPEWAASTRDELYGRGQHRTVRYEAV